MSAAMQTVVPAWHRTRCSRLRNKSSWKTPSALRLLSTSQSQRQDLQVNEASTPPPPPPSSQPPKAPSKRGQNPQTVVSPRRERQLLRERRLVPIGSRRSRAARSITPNIPFSQLPYQCFQEARKILAADREEKIQQIVTQQERIKRLQAQDEGISGGQKAKELRLESMQRHMEELKILADINDPLVKKKYEDGNGDMTKPIYRYLADREWRAYKRKVLMQRIEQMTVVPDVLPVVDPTIDVDIRFGKKNIQPGEKVYSSLSEQPPSLTAQVFDKGERLVTVVFVDSDVPNVEDGSFGYRCHGVFTNLLLSPIEGRLDLPNLPAEQVALAWIPPTSYKGAPYHRLSIWILQHPVGKDGKPTAISATDISQFPTLKSTNFNMRSFLDTLRAKFGNNTERFTPVGVTMFRTEWDEGMDGVMKRAGIEDWNLEFKNEKPLKLPYKKKRPDRYR